MDAFGFPILKAAAHKRARKHLGWRVADLSAKLKARLLVRRSMRLRPLRAACANSLIANLSPLFKMMASNLYSIARVLISLTHTQPKGVERR